jgi:RecA-family ATPase
MTAPARTQRPIDVLKNLPANIEAEKSFLGSVFLHNGVLDREILTPEDFRLESNRRIYMAMLELWEGRIPIDPVILSGHLEKKNWSRHTGGFDYLDELSIVVPTAANASHYARILKEQTALRRAKILNAQHAQAIEEGNLEEVERIEQKMAENHGEESDSSIDATDLCSVPPREHIVEDWITRGIAIALHGPPGTGKSVFLTNMTVSVAEGVPFYGMRTFPGRVLYVSNEWTDKDEVSRIWYPKTRNIKPGRLTLEPSGPLLEWVSTEKDGQRKGEWIWTKKGREILGKIEKMRPDLIILDTILGLCSGVEQLNNPMTYELGRILQEQVASSFNVALIAVAHTSQASSKESLEQRLHYESMAGGNGLPGYLRMTIGLTKIRESDFGKDVEALSRSLVAVGSSKYNIAGFKPIWTEKNPGFFAWGQSELELDPDPRSAIIRKEREKKEKVGRSFSDAKEGDDDNFLPF